MRRSSGTYRTLCVRTCDGYYFPISYSTVPSKFADDEQLCQRLCPATEVTLYSHRNPGEDVARAVSSDRPVLLRTAQRVQLSQGIQRRLQCRAPGQSWADALRQGQGPDQTVERGDIVVTEEQARRCRSRASTRRASRSSPTRPAGIERGRGLRCPASRRRNPGCTRGGGKGCEEPGKRKVRSVGPTFFPVR